jgi:DcuC family C4-dicarboxylate transporter
MVWIGALIVIATFYFIIRNYETRLVLFLSGLIMALISGKLPEAFKALAAAMANAGLVPIIVSVMGFAFVMKLTKCDEHMVNLLAGGLVKARPLLIPGTVLLTFAINMALPSAAGVAAAVGAILIPALMSVGVHPALAASAVMAGTWGSVFSPGSAHNVFIAKMAETDVMSVIAGHATAAVAGVIFVAIALTITAYIRKEHTGHKQEGIEDKAGMTIENPSVIKAIVPAFPLFLLVIFSRPVLERFLSAETIKGMHLISVPEAMIYGCVLAFLVTRVNPQKISTEFFNGAGRAYADVIGIIVAAAVFIKGMEVIGLTGALIEFMKDSQDVARIASVFGPFVVAVLSGSGDAATLAFNGAITPHAAHFGYTMTDMGSQAFLGGALGRSMSPVAGAAIICATLARVSPIEITKRNAIPMILAAILVMFIMT